MSRHLQGGDSQGLILEIQEQLAADMAALLVCCQETNRLLGTVLERLPPGQLVPMPSGPALAPGVTPPPFLVASVHIPTAGGDLAVDSPSDFILELEEGVTMAYIQAIFLIASANTVCNLYLYDRGARSPWSLFYIDEDIVIPPAPLDGTREVTTARLDVNSVGWPGLLWRSAENNRRIYGRIRNQTAGVGGAVANFVLTLFYVPVSRPE